MCFCSRKRGQPGRMAVKLPMMVVRARFGVAPAWKLTLLPTASCTTSFSIKCVAALVLCQRVAGKVRRACRSRNCSMLKSHTPCPCASAQARVVPPEPLPQPFLRFCTLALPFPSWHLAIMNAMKLLYLPQRIRRCVLYACATHFRYCSTVRACKSARRLFLSFVPAVACLYPSELVG